MSVRVLLNIDVADLERAEAFYTRAFDLRVSRRFGSAGIELVGAECPIYLLAQPAGTFPFDGASTPRNYHRHWTPVHLDFVVDDLEAAVTRAEGAGARRESPIREEAWGRLATFSDPFGNGFCLLSLS